MQAYRHKVTSQSVEYADELLVDKKVFWRRSDVQLCNIRSTSWKTIRIRVTQISLLKQMSPLIQWSLQNIRGSIFSDELLQLFWIWDPKVRDGMDLLCVLWDDQATDIVTSFNYSIYNRMCMICISLVKMHFCYGKLNILCNLSNIPRKPYVPMFTQEQCLLRRSIALQAPGQAQRQVRHSSAGHEPWKNYFKFAWLKFSISSGLKKNSNSTQLMLWFRRL